MLIAMGIADAVRRLTRTMWVPAVVAPVVVVVVRGAVRRCGISATFRCWRSPPPPASAGSCCVPAQSEPANTKARRWPCSGSRSRSLILLSGWASDVGGLVERWSSWVDIPGIGDVSPNRLLMVVGVVLLQFVTGNQLVRLVLGSVGAVKPEGQPQPSDRLKGGRLLGPMERTADPRARAGRSARRGHRRRRRQEHHPVPGDQRPEGPRERKHRHRRRHRVLPRRQLRQLDHRARRSRARAVALRAQSRSMIVTLAVPPPSHIVCRP